MRFLFFVLCCLMAVTGCKQSLDTQFVEGVVTLDGKPLPAADIVFIPVDETVAFLAGGSSNSQGVYRLTSNNGGDPEKGAVAGEYTVTVYKMETVRLPKPIRHDDGTVTTETSRSVLLPVYANQVTTPLRFDVKKGKNKIDLELFSKLPN